MFRFGGFAVQFNARYGARIVVYSATTKRRDKRRANRTYRRAFRQAVHEGLEAPSEFNPRPRCFLTDWDIS